MYTLLHSVPTTLLAPILFVCSLQDACCVQHGVSAAQREPQFSQLLKELEHGGTEECVGSPVINK